MSKETIPLQKNIPSKKKKSSKDMKKYEENKQ